MTASQFELGDVLLVQYPFTDRSASKRRPVLVVSVARFNKGEDIVVVPISSQPPPRFGFPIRDTDDFFDQSGLRWTSTVKWTKPLTITGAMIARRLGSLPRATMMEILAKLKTVFTP